MTFWEVMDGLHQWMLLAIIGLGIFILAIYPLFIGYEEGDDDGDMR